MMQTYLPERLRSNVVIGVYEAAFQGGQGAGTSQVIPVPLPPELQQDALYLVAINNPAALSAGVTVTFSNGILFGGEMPVPCAVSQVTVASGVSQCYLIQGWLLGDASASITVTLNTTASASGGTVQIQVILV